MSRVSLALRQGVRGHLNPFILRVRGDRIRAQKPLVISGYFRSGTTWLAELVATAARAGILFEPFHIQNVSKAREAGFSYSNFRLPDEEWPTGQAFVEAVLRGENLDPWTVSHIPLHRAFRMQRLVVKLVSANQMLGWLVETFDIPPPVLLIRHPCAVLASWLNRGWRLNDWLMLDPKLVENHPEIGELISGLNSEEEYFAAQWCIDHYIPLVVQKPQSLKVVSFEKLVTSGADYFQQVLDVWDISLPDHVRHAMRRPSEKASSNLAISYEAVLSSWRKSLSSRQRRNVLRVVREFGLSFYTEDIEPDYEWLFGLGS